MNRNSLHIDHTTAPRQLWSQLRMTLCVLSIRRRQWCSWISSAFDTIDHSILLNRLHKRYGITRTALSWFETYLTDCSQVIQLNGESSDEMRLQFGVPQGSVLGPLLFTSYTAPLGEIARRHGVELHLYADDTQVYMSFSPLSDESTTRTFQRIEACIAEIRTWLKGNKQMLDDDKTDVLVISSVSMRSKLQVPHLKIGSSIVTPSPVVRNIGLYMNSVMNMEQQICQSCFFHIFSIGKIRHLLNNKSTEILVHAFIT